MAVTTVRGEQILDGDVQRVDLDIATAGQAVTRRIIAGTNITLGSTGVDTGTGDVTINSTDPLTFGSGLTRTTNAVANNLITGLAGGQTIIGGTATGENLTLQSTAHATKGKILFGTSAYDEVNNRLGIGTTTPTSAVHIKGAPATLQLVEIQQAETGTGTSAKLGFTNSTSEGFISTGIASIRSATSGGLGHLAFFTRTSTIQGWANLSERMRILDTGQVGIGTPTPATSATLDLTSTTGALLLTRMTTAQRDALTAVDGMLIYNTTLAKLQGYEGGAWASLI